MRKIVGINEEIHWNFHEKFYNIAIQNLIFNLPSVHTFSTHITVGNNFVILGLNYIIDEIIHRDNNEF